MEDTFVLSFFLCIVLGAIFSNLGSRNPSPTYKKGVVAKIMPWALLVFLALYAVISIYQLSSMFSRFYQLSSMSSRFLASNIIWQAFLTKVSGVVVFVCWTCYAFAFKRSDTSAWKKACKVVAYVLLTLTIEGAALAIHEFKDFLLVSAVFVLPAVLLLWAARVKPAWKIAKQESRDSIEKTDGDK